MPLAFDIPASVGLILLTIAKRRARTLALANVKMDQGLPPPTRNALLEAGPEQLNPDVRELFNGLAADQSVERMRKC